MNNQSKTGAQHLVASLLSCGVRVCFANPGTSEMHFVGALDESAEMRCVLCLFEGVATGAADGYGRMAGGPAATLLHLGPGLANGLANLHNAKRAATPVINVIGDHATYHVAFDSPLTADVEAIARPFSAWVKTCPSADDVPKVTGEALGAAQGRPGGVASFILPADVAWSDSSAAEVVPPAVTAAPLDAAAVAAAAAALRDGGPTLLLLSGEALLADGLAAAGRITEATGADMMATTFAARIERGAGRVPIRRLPYPVDQGLAALEKYRSVILVGAKDPVAFFAYPGKPSRLLPEGCNLVELASSAQDLTQALEALADAVGAAAEPAGLAALDRPALPEGALTADKIAQAVGALMPEQAIVVDESVSSGRAFLPLTEGAPAHTWLPPASGSIGIGMPLACGAAVACPDRQVIGLQSDGSALYTPQALWTQAREKLNILTIILSNGGYAILKGEMRNVGFGEPGQKARDMLEIDRPPIDWPALAKGQGVAAGRAETAEDFVALMQKALDRPGPFLIEAVI